MRRAERLFDIVQCLRGQARPVTGAALAAQLEVSTRTIYRDIVALQGSGVPIDGASGLGYVLDPAYALPTLTFTPEELQTIAVALELVRRTGDRGLMDSAGQIRRKIAAVLPESLRARGPAPFWVSARGAVVPATVCMGDVRDAIRGARKLRIAYSDEHGAQSRRTIWPLAVAYYAESTLIGAWCELRHDYRHFRADRVGALTILDERYPADQPALLAGWRALHEASA